MAIFRRSKPPAPQADVQLPGRPDRDRADRAGRLLRLHQERTRSPRPRRSPRCSRTPAASSPSLRSGSRASRWARSRRSRVVPGGTGTAEVTMEVKKTALPLHDGRRGQDPHAHLPRGQLLRGHQAGHARPRRCCPRASPIPMNQTYGSVQLGDVLRVLKSDVRGDLRTLLAEFSLKGLGGGGAEAFNDTIDYMEPAYRSTSVVNDALLGENPTRDLQRVLKGQQRVAAALTVDPDALQGLVTNVNTTAGALAREDVSLAASIPALRDLLKTGSPALASLNDALPSLRALRASRRCPACAPHRAPSTPRCPSCARPASCSPRPSCAASPARRAPDPAPGAPQRDAAAAARRGRASSPRAPTTCCCPASSRRSPRPSRATPARRSAAS